MGKNRNSKFEVLDMRTQESIQVDSNEEVLVYKWLLRALELGIVDDFKYQPTTFVLSEKQKYVSNGKERTLFQDHVYSPDFLIRVNGRHRQLLSEFKVTFDRQIYVDVKGSFNRNQRSFSIDQKWVYQKTGYYIYKLEPKVFFRKFGILDEFKFTQKTRKPSKVFAGYPTIEDVFINGK